MPRLNRPSPLSQGNYTAAEKRRSRDDSDIAALIHEQTPTATVVRNGGLKGRLRRALSFNAAQTLKEEEADELDADEDDDESIKASQVNGKLKTPSLASTTVNKVNATSKTGANAGGNMSDQAGPSVVVPPAKKKGRAASLFNSRLNASTDNISLSSTVSSASVMIRKLGAMGKLARRNSLAGITSLFKDKDKDKDGKDDKDDKKDKKGKKKEKSAKGSASEASVSHVTAELDRMGGDWNVGAEMNGLSPAAKLARQHTLKSNAEAAARAKEAALAKEKEAEQAAQAQAAAAAAEQQRKLNGIQTQVPAWDRNTATRSSPVKAAGGGGVHRINEDGTRTLVESDDEESEDGHYRQHQQQGFHADGWDDDDDWDQDADGDEDVTIRVGINSRGTSGESDRTAGAGPSSPIEMEPWAVDIRRSVEKTRRPAKGILKGADSYDQQVYLQQQDHQMRARSNSYNHPVGQADTPGPLARIPSPDPDHIDGLHKHGHQNGPQQQSSESEGTLSWLPPLDFDSTNSSPLSSGFSGLGMSKDLPDTPPSTSSSSTTITTSSSSITSASSSHENSNTTITNSNRSSAIYQHANFNASAPALSTSASGTSSNPPTLQHRSATTPVKRLTFATNLSVYDTFSASVYDRRSEPATWSRLTPALAQRIKEELNSYKMEEMEVHAASRVQYVLLSSL